MTSIPSDSNLELAAERFLPFEVARIWEQCTSKKGLESWWSPEDFRTTVKRFEARPGGEVVLLLQYVPAMVSSEAKAPFLAARIPISFSLRGHVREMERNRRLVLELTLTLDRAGTGVETVTRLQFEPVGTGTKVRLIVTGTNEPHMVTLGKTNLEGQLDRLSRSLGGAPEPHP